MLCRPWPRNKSSAGARTRKSSNSADEVTRGAGREVVLNEKANYTGKKSDTSNGETGGPDKAAKECCKIERRKEIS